MLSGADEEQLQRVCANEETVTEARKLIPLAKTRTKPGTGYYLLGLTTGIPAVCAYLASTRLNNNDVTLDSARRSSCLNPTDFALALRNITKVLKPELNPKKRRKEITYDILHEKYHVGMSFSTFSTFLRQAENALIQLDGRLQLESPNNRCAIFFWASSIIKVKELPTLDEFAQDNSLLPERLTPIIKILDDKCNSLKAKLAEVANNPSRPSSPTKLPSTPRTPRRSPKKPLRELPTRESVKKQRQNPSTEASPLQSQEPQDDVEMASLETPTKKRKLETPNLTASPSKKRLPFPPTTPSTSHITHITSPTKSKLTTTTATIPSPLRRSARFVLQEEVDDEMDVDEDDVGGDVNRSLEVDLSKVAKEDDEEEEEGLEEPVVVRRFRPVYQDLKQWYARDAKVLRMWKTASENELVA